MFQACEPAHGAATPTAAQSSDTQTKHTQIKNHVMRASTLTFIATWTRWAGSWEEGGVMARRCARGFHRLSQGKLGTAIRKKNVFFRLPETAPHSYIRGVLNHLS